MKTKEQIIQFLKNCSYKSQMDFEGIKFYCKEKFNIRLKSPEFYENKGLDYSMFAEWIETGIAAGDAVKWGDCIGLVQSAYTDKLDICLRIDGNGSNFDFLTISIQGITKAGESALKRLKIVINENHMQFSNKYFVLAPKMCPKPGDIVEFTSCTDDLTGCGIFRCYKETEAGSEVYMNCMYIKGDVVRYNMNEYLGMLDDFIFESVTSTDYPRKLLETELNKVGKTWNHHLRRIEPLNMKVNEGEYYWYISDKMAVTKDIEKGRATSHKRYLVGNYYKSELEAITMLEAFFELRNKKLAEPESTSSSAQ